MAVAIAWLPGSAGTRRRVAKPSVEEPDAAEPARPDLWGARVSNDPGLPDRPPSLASPNPSGLFPLKTGFRHFSGQRPSRRDGEAREPLAGQPIGPICGPVKVSVEAVKSLGTA